MSDAATRPGGDLTTAPIPELIRRLAIPASIGFFFNTMYNVVDTYFAGQLSTTALAALSGIFPNGQPSMAMAMSGVPPIA